MHRRALAAVIGLCVALLPSAALADTGATSRTQAGTARTQLELLTVEVTGSVAGLLGSLSNVSVAVGRSVASTDTDTARNTAGRPYALAGLRLPVVGELSATSDGHNRMPARTVALPAGLGSVSAGNLEAVADRAVARSLIDVLSGHVALPVGAVRVGLPTHGVGTTVDTASATARNGAVLNEVSVRLGDLLPAGLLDQLPLSVLLDLVRTLPVQSADLTAAVQQLEALLGQLGALPGLEQQLRNALAQLTAVLGPLDAALSGTGAPLDTAALQSLVDELDAVLGTIDGLAGQLDATLQHITGLLGQLGGTDLTDLIDDLLNRIANLELIGIDRIAVAATATASDTTSGATTTCQLGGLRVLGVTVPGVADCTQLGSALQPVQNTLRSVLGALPVRGALPADLVSIEGLRSSATPANQADGLYRVAQASLTALDLQLRSVSLKAVTDGLVDGLLDALDDLLALLGGDLLGLLGGHVGSLGNSDLRALLNRLLGGGLPVLDGGLTQLVGGLQDIAEAGGSDPTAEALGLVRQLGGGATYSSTSSTAGTSQLVRGLVGELGALPTGAVLGGLSTPGVRLRALSIASDSQFTAAGAPPVAVPVAVPQTTPPANTHLPKTGGGFALGLLLLLAGGSFGALRRRASAA